MGFFCNLKDISIVKMVLMVAIIAAFFGKTLKMGVNAQR